MGEFRPPKELVFNDNLVNNWKLFKQKFQNYLRASGNDKKDEEVQVAMFLNCIGDEALEVYNTFKITDEKKLQPILEAFDQYCEPQKNVIYNRFKFFSRSQSEGETIDHFVTDLRKLAKLCEFKEEDTLIRDRIVIGVRDQNLQERLLRLSDLTLNEAITQGRAAETSKQQLDQIKGKEVNFIKKKSSPTQKPSSNVSSKSGFVKNSSHNVTAKSSLHRPSSFKCSRCSREHGKNQCPAYGKRCVVCKKLNHFAVACQKQKKLHECHTEVQDEDFFVDTLECSKVKVESLRKNDVWMESVFLCNQDFVDFKLDTGAQCNVLPLKRLKSLNVKYKLEPANFKVVTYANKELDTLGSVTLDAIVRGRKGKIKFVVVDTTNVPILGLNTCVTLNLLQRLDDIKSDLDNPTSNVPKPKINSKDDLVKKYEDVFTGVGKFQNKLKLELNENTVPVVNSVRRVPESIKPKLKETLDRLVHEGTITPVNHVTNWVNNVVIVEKPNKSLRICLDPAELNKCIKSNPFPIPSTSELELVLRGKKYFTVLDMKDGFHQIELDEESSLLTTFITPFGKYRFNRLPFGLSVSPEIFQRYNTQVFGDIDQVGIYFDDFVIATSNESEHDQVLAKVMQRARECNVKFNKNKLQFKVSTVKYLGLIFSEKGVESDPERVKSILALNEPSNKKELQSVLGMANFFCKFVPNMTEVTAPLRQLLKNNVDWLWTEDHSKAFNNLKNKIKETAILKIFDPKVPIDIYVDASNHSVGACLMQSNMPVAFCSKALSDSQIRYPIIDKEMYALCFAATKFHNYIYGNHVTMYSDHKPLMGIMDKGMHNVSSRLQKFKLQLMKYDVSVKYLPGKSNVIADILSRYTKSEKVDDKPDVFDKTVVIHSLNNQLAMSEVKKQKFRDAMKQDPMLQKIVTYVHEGWPSHKKLLSWEEKMFYKVRDNILYEKGLLFVGCKLVIPFELRESMLNLVHEAHLGLNKCKARARSLFFWPGMSSQLEKLVLACKLCEKFRFKNCKETLLSFPQTSRPWERISCDLFDFAGESYMTVVDAYSNWIELEKLSSKSASSIIEKLKTIFSRFGSPDIFMSDNVPFNSQEFMSFAKDWNFEPITSSPYHARSNGLAEKAVSICKNLLRRAKGTNKDISFFLLEYRNTPLVNLNMSPSQLFLCRLLKTKLPTAVTLLKPKVVQKPVNIVNSWKRDYHYNKTARNLSVFKKGDDVLVRKNNAWVPGEVVNKHNVYPRSYIVRDEDGGEYRRNRVMLRKSYNKTELKSSDDIIPCQKSNENNSSVNESSEITSQKHTSPVKSPLSTNTCTRSGRTISAPKYLKDYVT